MKLTFWKEERGSASVEFVLLAIPLFLPIFLYLNYFAEASDNQEKLRTLARESARAFVTSANDQIAFEVAQSVTKQGGAILGFSNPERDLYLEIKCRRKPCISSDNLITVSLTSVKSSTKVSVIEYVTPWS